MEGWRLERPTRSWSQLDDDLWTICPPINQKPFTKYLLHKNISHQMTG